MMRKGTPYYIEKPKTESGDRCIPMTDEVFWAFQNAPRSRKAPKVTGHLEHTL